MSKDYKAAYRYARSFFLIMKGKSRQAEGNAELERVLAFSGSHPEFSHLLLAANLAAAEKAEIIDNLFSGGENKLSDQADRQGQLGQAADGGLSGQAPADRQGRFDQAAAGSLAISADTRNFIKLLVEKGRFNLFEKIAESYRKYFDSDRGVEEVTAVVPFALSGDAEARLVSALEKRLGKKISLSTRIDPDILGGIIVQTQSQVIDGSFRGKLKGLRQSLLSAGREN